MHAVASRQPDRRGLLFAAALLLLAGMWQLGGGLAIRGKAILAQILVRDAWERTLKGERQAKPWPWADTWPVARLSVPAQRIDLFVLAGANGRTIAFGPGHVFGTAPPGEEGNSVSRFSATPSRERSFACSGRTAYGAATGWRPLRCSTPRIYGLRARTARRASRWSPATRSTRCARAGRSVMWCLRTRSRGETGGESFLDCQDCTLLSKSFKLPCASQLPNFEE
jgi:hypothetical protein